MANYPLAKIVQKLLYDYLAIKFTLCHKIGIVACLAVTAIWLADSLGGCKHPADGRCVNNLLNMPLPGYVCLDQPIDVVYTWVNGSDPNFQQQLKDARLKLRHLADSGWRHHCPLEDCVPASLVFVMPQLPRRLPLSDVRFFISGPSPLEMQDSRLPELPGTILRYNSLEDARRVLLQPRFRINDENYTLYQTFWTSAEASDHSFHTSTSVADGKHVMITGVNDTAMPTEAKVVARSGSILIWRFPDATSSAKFIAENHVRSGSIHVNASDVSGQGSVVGVLASDSDISEIPNETDKSVARTREVETKKVDITNQRVVKAAHLILRLTEVDKSAVDASRFEDSQELRYSLRSLERYAPWVRHVYLVTNGQIPDWLSLDAGKLTIVTHEEIFPDPSDLPTFSSPAIECHLHRIPGLSKRFLYFNDDVLLDSPVWPDDFYTQSRGYNVYLAWLLPDCAAGCSHYWLNDGRCDAACNNAACSWDAGDCDDGSAVDHPLFGSNELEDRTTPPLVAPDDDDHALHVLAEEPDPCRAECQDSWLGDRFCDPGCNAAECGYDLGDCGVALYRDLYSPGQLRHGADYVVPTDAYAVFWNVSWISGQLRLNRVAFPPLQSVRGLVLDLKLGVLTLLRRSDVPLSELPVFITAAETGKEKMGEERLVEFRVRSADSLVKRPDDEGISSLVSKMTHENTSSLSERSMSKLSDKVIGQMSFQRLRSRRPSEHLRNRTERQSLGGNNSSIFTHSFPVSNTSVLAVANHTSSGTYGVSMLPRRLMSLGHPGTRGKYDSNVPLPFSAAPHQRLDTFGASLLHVNQLYSQRYGAEHRRAVAHMPHLLERDIIDALQSTFPDEFARTSAGRVRSGTDMQFAFAYFYYLMSEKKPKSAAELFDEVDTDDSGTWSDREIRTLTARLRNLPLTLDDLEDVWSMLRRCAERAPEEAQVVTRPGERYWDSDLPTITRGAVLACAEAVKELEEKLGKGEHRYPHHVLSAEDVVFTRVQDNASRLVAALDIIRRYPRKFLCFNNEINMGANLSEVFLVYALLTDFFESILPTPSQFELPPGLRNRFGHVKELKEWQTRRTLLRILAFVMTTLLVLSILYPYLESRMRAWRWGCFRRRHYNAQLV